MSENGEQAGGRALSSREEWIRKENAVANTHATGKRYVFKVVDSPVRKLTLVATDEGLAAILWENDRPQPRPPEHRRRR